MSHPFLEKNRDQIRHCPHLINDEWVHEPPTHHLNSPYTGAPMSSFSEASAQKVNQAVQSASQAAVAWGNTPIKERTQVLFRFRDELLKSVDEISATKSFESGKTLPEAKAGLMKGIEVLEFALSLQNLDSGSKMEVSRGVSCEYRRVPLGVVAAITPFNFPAMVPMWMLPIAIALGNAFVWKPSDKTPMTSILIGECLQRAGLPKGVLTILQGGQITAEAITGHPDIAAVGFVGSTPVAKKVYQKGSERLKRVLALGGAKNHIILLPDADPEMAAQGIADSFTGCAGQRCMAASVLLAVGDVDSIIDQMIEKVSQIVPGKNMGAIITRPQVEFLHQAIQSAEDNGAKIRIDGRSPQVPEEFSKGNWLAPTVLDSVSPGSEAATRELFGPTLSIIRCKDLSEALAIEKSCLYGNATSVFTRSGGFGEEVVKQATSGMVGINIGVPVPREPFSFGGLFESKFGVGDITGINSLNFWSNQKKVTVKWSQQKDSNWMS